MRPFAKRAFDFLSSYGLSCVLFILLLLLTYLGTLEQVDHGLYATRAKYFESLFFVHYVGNVVPLVLPGAYLLMALLAVNLTCGGIVRAKKGWRQLGTLISHGGILVLFVGAFVAHEFAANGQQTLYEGESSAEFAGYRDWEIGVSQAQSGGTVTEHIIPASSFMKMKGDDTVTFNFPGLPIRLILTGFAANSEPHRVPAGTKTTLKVVGGYTLAVLEPDVEGERDIPGAYATVEDGVSGEKAEGILWGASRHPLGLTVSGSTWSMELRKKRWPLPFTVKLNKFTHEVHPRTNMPKVFASDVTVTEGGLSQDFRIGMNEPLRYKGFTFFQSSWGPQDARPNEPLYSVFAVVKNPADQFPKYACIIITIGLALHFILRLLQYTKEQGTKIS